jgi:ketosteroid isomerase-like protein
MSWRKRRLPEKLISKKSFFNIERYLTMKYLACLLVVLPLLSKAQDVIDPNLKSMLDAEIDFAAMAKEKNTRDAFLTFLSEHAITFGKDIQVGLRHYEAQVPNSSLLIWKPEFGDISASGDFGYDFGPWKLFTERTDTRPVGFGHFISIWNKNHNGQWKNMLDIGISHPEGNDSVTAKTSINKPRKVKKGDFHSVTEIEEEFIQDFSANGDSAYYAVASEELKLFRNGKLPIMSAPEIDEFFKADNADIDYVIVGGAIAKSKDLAYVYGRATIKNSKDGHITTNEGFYLRVWKKEDGRHWKIVLDVLR